jgi:uncharacterized protein (DUF305 family)
MCPGQTPLSGVVLVNVLTSGFCGSGRKTAVTFCVAALAASVTQHNNALMETANRATFDFRFFMRMIQHSEQGRDERGSTRRFVS